MRTLPLLATIASLFLAGCAAVPMPYPSYKTTPTVAVSATTLSTMTETPAADKLLDNSQVFIRGGSIPGASGYFGALGALAGISAARASNLAAVSEVAGQLSMKFDKVLSESLHRATSHPPHNGNVQLQAQDTKVDLLLLPYAVFETQPGAKAALMFQIAARFNSAANTPQLKSYVYLNKELRPFAGTTESWTANDNAKIHQLSRVAFDRLSITVLNDLSGKYPEPSSAEKPRFTTYQAIPDGPIQKAILLEEAAGYQVVLLESQHKVVRSLVLVIDNNLIKGAP